MNGFSLIARLQARTAGQSGATRIEYAIIIAAIAVAVVAVGFTYKEQLLALMRG